MLLDIKNYFQDLYNKDKENLIINNYPLKKGIYIKLEKNDNINYLLINKNNLDFKSQEGEKLFKWFQIRDYFSKLLTMNKPIYNKTIHSNNFLCISFKYDKNFTNSYIEKIKENIDTHYIEINNMISIKDDNYALLQKVQHIMKKNIDNILNFIKSNIDIQNNLKDKEYIKIFINEDSNVYLTENIRYLNKSIYVDKNYNKNINDDIVGIPCINMTLNKHKPNLIMNTTPFKGSFYATLEDSIIMYRLLDMLYYLKVNIKKDNDLVWINKFDKSIFIPNKNNFIPSELNNLSNEEINQNSLSIKNIKIEQQQGRPLITNYDNIPYFDKNLDFDYINILKLSNKDGLKPNFKIANSLALENYIRKNFFSDKKIYSLYEDFDKITKSDLPLIVKTILKNDRTIFYNYFHNGQSEGFYSKFIKDSLIIIETYLKNNINFKLAQQCFNLRYSIINYKLKKEGKEMTIDYTKIKTDLKNKLEQNIFNISDEEYYFLVGQVYYYLISHSKTKNPSHSLLLPIINAKTNELMKKVIEREYSKYSHELNLFDTRFKNALLLINTFEPTTYDREKNKSYLHAGLLYNQNIFYERKEVIENDEK